MSFARRIIRIRKKAVPALSAGEQACDPTMVATENVTFTAVKEKSTFGKPRASGLYAACIRQHIIGTLDHLEQVRWSAFSNQITYGIGSAVHYWMQNTPDIFGDRRRGWWKCLACGKIGYFGAPPKKKYRCRFCGARSEAFVYYEHPLNLSGEYPVTGHPDMFLEKLLGVFRVLEIKTMNLKDFQKLIAPLIDHSWQIHTYVWACGQKEAKLPVKIDQDLAYIAYVAKQQSKEFPIKIFPVRIESALIDRIKVKLSSYRIGLRDFPKGLPEAHVECSRGLFDNYRAKSCPCRKKCIVLDKGGL